MATNAAAESLPRYSSAPLFTNIPARLDRLPWSRFHWLVVWALGITWILDGLEVTLVGAVSGVLQEREVMNFTPAVIGFIASMYLTGAVLGSLVFGYLTDRWGRKRLFFLTLTVYLVGVLLTALSWDQWSFALFRFMTGAGIGGEYAAINSTIDELIPAAYRGRVDIIVNGSYWIGAALGSASTIVILDPHLLPPNIGWRIGFGMGALVGLFILGLRKYIPESPRWLMTHGYQKEAEESIGKIECEVSTQCGQELKPIFGQTLKIHPRKAFGFGAVARTMLSTYPSRSILGLLLMISQAFLYNAVFFTYALILTRFYDVPAGDTGIYLLPFALGNFLGPLILGHFFDVVGRRQMISATYGVSALLLAMTGWLFSKGLLSAHSQTALWTVIFFFASAAASSAYLTVSEIFPLEIRALAIALFFSIGTAAGGVVAPWLFGALIGSGSRVNIFYGYLVAAILMLVAAAVEARYGLKAERTPLEDLAVPLSMSEE
jgi:MFS family permease